MTDTTTFEAVRDGRVLHASVTGSPDAPLVVLIAGLGQGSKLFGTLPRRFAREGFRCVVFDPVGIPPSSPHPEAEPWRFEDAADDVVALTEALDEGSAPVALVGTSLGGKVGVVTAARHPDKIDRMVTLASSFTPSERGERVFRFFRRVAQHVPDEAFGDVVAPFLIGRSFIGSRPAVVDDLARAMKPTSESRVLMQAQADALANFDGAAAAGRVRCPTLCLAGEEDTLTDLEDVRATARAMPDARFETIRNAGHSLLLESRDALDRVLEFLRGRGED